MAKHEAESHGDLFDLDHYFSERPSKVRIDGKVWTKNKAQLIASYLRDFVQVTRGGFYLDAFAGPQNPDAPDDCWAAKLALENEPKRLRRFYLFEKDPDRVAALEVLQNQHDTDWRRRSDRHVIVTAGDSNETIPRFLHMYPIGERTPTFCLLDQRTWECDWDLVCAIARHKARADEDRFKKQGRRKIELFYFLAQHWIARNWDKQGGSVQDRKSAWWGGGDPLGLDAFRKSNFFGRAEIWENRFKNELGYEFAQAFPIYERGREGRVMFSMIHASDDPRALPLMGRAYRKLGLRLPKRPPETSSLEWGSDQV